MPIKDRIGQQLYNNLLVRLNPHGQNPQPRYALTIKLSESKSELAVRKTAFATRANLEVTAGFTLFDYQSGKNVTSGTSSISVSFNILASEYGTSVAIKDARTNAVRELAEDIRIRLGVYLDGLQGQG